MCLQVGKSPATTAFRADHQQIYRATTNVSVEYDPGGRFGLDLSQLPKFENTRGRFVRVSDLTEYRGWVVGERNLRFVIQLEGIHDVAAGEDLLGEMFLMDWTLKVRARILQTNQRDGDDPMTIIAMEAHNVNAQHGTGRERFRVHNMSASVHTRTARLAGDCSVQDISLDGFGLILPEEPRVGTHLRVDIDTEAEPLSFQCEVRYVKPDNGAFRCGLLIQHQDRVTERKWHRFLAHLNERTAMAA